MKIGKWHIWRLYLRNEVDDFIYERNISRELKEKIKFYEKINYKQYKEIEKLKKENEFLKNHQRIEIVNLEG